MSDAVIVALLGFLGTIVGSGVGVLSGIKLITYRLEQLEKKVNLHNNVIERVYELEKQEALMEQEIRILCENEVG